jgi:hydroxypyruvate isomerase
MPKFLANLSFLCPEHGFADRFAAAAGGVSSVCFLFVPMLSFPPARG